LAKFLRSMRRFEPDAVLVEVDGDAVYWMEERDEQAT
jgi:hypothetical protein